MKNRKHIKGISLPELILAALILFWLVFGLIRILNSVGKTISVSKNEKEISEQLRTAAALMHDEMRLAVVRTNPGRLLNMWVNDDGIEVNIYFCKPTEPTGNLTNTQPIQYTCYFWEKNSSNVYRAVTNLNYQSASDWRPQINGAREDAKNNPPMLSHISDFKILLYTNAPTSNAISLTNQWTDSTNLPIFVKIQLGIQESKETNSLRNFIISIPMLYKDVNNLNAQ